VIRLSKQKRVIITLKDEDLKFFKEHVEISPSGLMEKAIKDYREKLEVAA
jgi:hypothetical protein